VSFDAASSDALHHAVREHIARCGSVTEEEIERTALAIARYQAACVEPVGRMFSARGVDAAALRAVADVPALPADAFRITRVAAHPEADDVRVFRTSGTTQGGALRGAHPMRTLATYEAAALRWAGVMLFSGRPPPRAVVLAPASRDAPDSSLSFMIDLFVERHAMRAAHATDGARVDAEAVARAAAGARAAGEPVFVFGTAFAMVLLLDALAGREARLPPGSRVMLTGGFKGRTREVDERELRASICGALGVSPADVAGEYGMTELSSQLYEVGPAEASPPLYRAPPWLRVEAAHPDSLAPLPVGAEGVARFTDLANVDSAMVVQTLDWVRIESPGTVRLLGRAPGAPPRGCSLAMEDLFGRARDGS
jgi:hypothetical protein